MYMNFSCVFFIREASEPRILHHVIKPNQPMMVRHTSCPLLSPASSQTNFPWGVEVGTRTKSEAALLKACTRRIRTLSPRTRLRRFVQSRRYWWLPGQARKPRRMKPTSHEDRAKNNGKENLLSVLGYPSLQLEIEGCFIWTVVMALDVLRCPYMCQQGRKCAIDFLAFLKGGNHPSFKTLKDIILV